MVMKNAILRILIKNIAGRSRAEEIEKEHIDAFKKQHGRNPRGNFKREDNEAV